MNAREERGMVIAATQKLTQKGPVWLVPSQSGRGKYTVAIDAETPYCSCPDHEETGCKCKHIYAVETVMKREAMKDGTIVETRTVTFTEKKTYKQDWPLYNLAQIEEKKRFSALLFDLCRGVTDPPTNKTGRKRTPMADMVFAAVMKVYTGFSSRRFGTDLEEAHGAGRVSRKLHPLMVCQFLENDVLTPVLRSLITASSLPLKAVESTFSPDSTGFSTSRFVRWYDEKYGAFRSGKHWVKAHIMCGTQTHVITAVEILDRDAADCPQFKALVEKTAEHFTINEISADKAYLSHENQELVDRLGGTAYIAFKVNSQPGEGGTLWEKLFHFYSLHRDEYMRHYHRRSNIESAISMLKAKFRDSVRSKTEIAMKNEVLAKIVAHNICCLIMSQLELGIAPLFWDDAPQVEPVPQAAPPVEMAPIDAAPVDAPLTAEPPARCFLGCVGA